MDGNKTPHNARYRPFRDFNPLNDIKSAALGMDRDEYSQFDKAGYTVANDGRYDLLDNVVVKVYDDMLAIERREFGAGGSLGVGGIDREKIGIIISNNL